MKEDVTPRERLDAAFSLRSPDRPPILGGWIACPAHIMEIVGVSEDEYWDDPQGISIQAYRSLGTDGLLGVFVPTSRGSYRCVDQASYAHAATAMSLEEAVANVDALPSPEQIESEFDFESSFAEYSQ